MIVILVFATLLILGVPIFGVLLASGMVGIETMTRFSLMTMPQQFFNSINQQTLLAIPFFLESGPLAAKGQTSYYLVKIMNMIFGRIRGGSAIAGLAACAFFAAISGSAMATVVAIGSIIIPALKETDYPEDLVVGSICSGGSIGILIPPSAPMVLFCVAMEVSVGRMFIAGFVPGLMLTLVWSLYIYVRCRKNNYGKFKEQSKEQRRKILFKSIPALLYPIIVLGSIYSGWATPTEAAAISVVYIMIIELFIYRKVKFRDLVPQFLESLTTSATLLAIIASAAVISYFITLMRVPDAVVAFVEGFVRSGDMLLLMVLLFLFLAGMFVDIISIIVVLAPILVPVLRAYNINLIFFGILAILCSQIGYISPPFGTNLFVTMRTARKDFWFVAKATMPYLLILVAFTIVLIFFPGIILWLPNQMM